MKMLQTLTTAAVGFATFAAMMLPGLVAAQSSGPSKPMHGVPPEATSTAAPALMAPMKRMHTEMMAMQMSGDLDHDFVMMMRSHHQAAVDMAKIELARGKDDNIKRMAEKMVADQTREIAELDQWMVQHGGMKK